MDSKIKQIKVDVLQASFNAGACHVGSSLSCVGILADLFYVKNIKPEQFIFSKASGVATYYAILADLGYFTRTKLFHYLEKYPLPSKEVPGVIYSTGSLGHGLSVAAGMALGDRTKDIYVLLSDGECQEGSTLEAVMFAAQNNLKNLHVIIDNNGLQACGETNKIQEIDWTFFKSHLRNCEVINTIKGDGVDFMENDYEWHYKNLTPELLDKALKQI